MTKSFAQICVCVCVCVCARARARAILKKSLKFQIYSVSLYQ